MPQVYMFEITVGFMITNDARPGGRFNFLNTKKKIFS